MATNNQNIQNTQEVQTTQNPTPNQPVNNQVEQKERYIDFGEALSRNVNPLSVFHYAKENNLDVEPPNRETFLQGVNVSEETKDKMFQDATDMYALMVSNNFDSYDSPLKIAEKPFPALMIYQKRGLPTRDIPEGIIHDLGTIYNAQRGNLGAEIVNPGLVADYMGYIFDKNGNRIENTRRNRIATGGLFSVEANPDPNSLVPYFWKQESWYEGLVNSENLRSYIGPSAESTHWLSSLIGPSSINSLLGGFVGQSFDAFGSIVRSLTVPALYFTPEENRLERMQSSYAMKAANSMSNFGSYMTHQNQDEKVGAFESFSAFMHNTYSGLGQLSSMIMVGRLSRDGFKMGLDSSAQMSILFGSAQRGAAMQNIALENGLTETQAAEMFFTYATNTYIANMVLGANILAKMGLRRGLDADRAAYRAMLKKSADSIGSLATASNTTRAAIANNMATGSIKRLMKMRTKFDDVLTKMSEKRVMGVPLGSMPAGAVEEFVEEGIEEVFDTFLLNPFYNKRFAVPRARAVANEYSQYSYDIEYDENGIALYFRTDRDGRSIELDYSTWQSEQQDLMQAQSVMEGNYYLEETLNWEEPIMGAVVGGIGAVPAFYIGGAYKARRNNDAKTFRQRLAIEISQKSARERNKAYEQIEKRFREQNEITNSFGSDKITTDGRVVSHDTQAEGAVSTLDAFINNFMDDLRLDVENILSFKINSVETMNAIRNDESLMEEALNTAVKIKSLQDVISSLQEGNTYDIPNELLGVITEGMDVDALNKTMQGLEQTFKDITQPTGKGQKSKRYQEIHGLSLYYDYKERLVAREAATEIFKKKKKKVNEDDPAFQKEVKKQIDRLRKKGYQGLIALDQTGFLAAQISRHGKRNVYKILESHFKKNIGGELSILHKRLNEKIQEASEVDFDKYEREVREAIEELQNKNFRILEDKDSSTTREFVDEVTGKLEALGQQMSILSDMGKHSQFEGNRQKYEDLFNDVNEAIKQVDDVLDVALNYDEYTSSPKFTPGVNHFRAENEAIVEKIQSALKAVNAEPSKYVHGEQTETFSELPSEIQSEMKVQAMKNLVEGLESLYRKDEKPSSVSLIESLNRILKTFETSSDPLSDQQVDDIIAQRNNLFERAILIQELLDINRNFFPTLKGEKAQYSPIKDTPYLQYTKNEADLITGKIKEAFETVEKIDQNEQIKKYNRQLDQVRHKVVNLAGRFHGLNNIQNVKELEDSLVDSPEFDIAIEALNKYLEDLSPERTEHSAEKLLNDLFYDYINDKATKEEKAEVLKKIDKVEELVLNAEETLGGKLDKYIEDLKSQYKDSADVYAYRKLEDYGHEEAIIRSGNELKGSMTTAYMNKNTKNDSYPNISQRRYHLLTYATILNRYGNKNKSNEIQYTIKEALNAFKEVQKQRREEVDVDGQKIDVLKEDFQVTTYEQEQAMLHVLSFLLEPDAANKLHRKEDLKEIIQKSLFVRGYAGTGKSTQLILDVIETYNMLTDSKVSVSILIPTSKLQQTHENNLSKIEYRDVQYVLWDNFINNNHKINGDIVIVDEASLWSPEMVNKVKDRFNDKKSIWIGDTNQTPPITKEYYATFPIQQMTAERTNPITEVFRSGYTDHYKIQSLFKSMINGNTTIELPEVVYKKRSDYFYEGARYFKDTKELRNQFMEMYHGLKDGEKNNLNLLYLVPQEGHFNEFSNWVEKNHGKDVLEDILEKKLVAVLDYNHNTASNTKEYTASGIHAHSVFFEYNPGDISVGNRNPEITNISASEGKALGRYGYTGASRQTNFLGIIGDTSKSKQGEPIHETNIDKQDSRQENHMALVSRLEKLTEGLSDKKKKKEEDEDEEPTVPKKNEGNRNVVISESNKNEIKKSENYKRFKSKNAEANNTVDGDTQSSITQASVLAYESLPSEIKTNEANFENVQNSLQTQVMVAALRYNTTKEIEYYKRGIEAIKQLNKLYTEAEKTKSEIKQPEKYFDSILKSATLPISMLNMVDGDFNFFGQKLLSKGVKIKNSEGNIIEKDIAGTPLMIELLGFDSKDKPIINIYDIHVLHQSKSKAHKTKGPYTKAKVGMYAALAQENGFLLNQVKIIDYTYDQATLSFKEINTISHDFIIEGYLNTLEYAFKNNDKISKEIPIVPIEGLYYQEKSIEPSAENIIMIDHYYANKDGVIQITDYTLRYDTDGNPVYTVYYTDPKNPNGKVHEMTTDAFKSYTPIRESAEFYYNNRFNRRATIHSDGHDGGQNLMHTHTLVLDPNVDGNLNSILSTPKQIARYELIGKLNDDKEATITKTYHQRFEGAIYDNERNSVKSSDFNHVIVNRISDDYLSKNKKLMVETLTKAGIENIDNMDITSLKNKFKEEKFDIIGYSSVPEYSFRKGKADKSNSFIGNSLFEDYMDTTNETKANELLAEMREMMVDGFIDSDGKPDKFQQQLIDYNIQKLKELKELKNLSEEGTEVEYVTAKIKKAEPGNIVLSRDEISANDLNTRLQAQGMSIVENSINLAYDGKRSYFTAEVHRKGFNETVTIELNAKTATRDNVDAYISNVDELLAAGNAINELEKIDNKNKEEIVDKARQAFKLINSSNAYQFVRANKATISDVMIKSQNENLTSLFEFRGKKGIEIIGATAKKKAENLREVLKQIKQHMADAGVYRMDAYSEKGNEKSKPVLENMVTNVRDIKTPDLYLETNEAVIKKAEETKVETSKTNEADDSGFLGIDDIDGLNLKLRESDAPLTIEQLASREQAVSEINSIIGQINAENRVSLLDVEIKTNNDARAFGVLAGDMIYLSGYKHNGEYKVHRTVARHESMHFVMKYLLNPKSHKRVVDDIIELLGDQYDGTMKQVYEYAADNFEVIPESMKPKNFFQRIMQAFKRLAHRLGAYSLNYKEMLLAADRGHFADMKIADHPNVLDDNFEKGRQASVYSTPEKIMAAKTKLGGHLNYEIIKSKIAIPVIKSKIGFGKGLGEHVTQLDHSIYQVIQAFSRNRDVIAQMNRSYKIEDQRDLKIHELKPKDYKYFINNKKNTEAAHYAIFNAGRHDISMVFLAELMPNTPIERLYRRFKQKLKKSNQNSKLIENDKGLSKSKALNIHSESQSQKASDRIPDILNLALSTVTNYTVVSEGKIQKGKTEFLPKRRVEEILLYVRNRIAKKQNPDKITTNQFFKELTELYKDSTDAELRNAIKSIEIEFGYANYKTSLSDSKQGYTGVGYMAILENPAEHSSEKINFDVNAKGLNNIEIQNTKDRINDINSLLSGIVSSSKSMAVYRQGIADFDKSQMSTKNSSAQAIEKFNLQNNVARQLTDEFGIVTKQAYEKITNSDSQIIIVDTDNVQVLQPGKKVEYQYAITKKLDHAKVNVHNLSTIMKVLGLGDSYTNETLTMLAKYIKPDVRTGKVRNTSNYLTALHDLLMATIVNYETNKALQDAYTKDKNLSTLYNRAKASLDPQTIKMLSRLETIYRESGATMETEVVFENIKDGQEKTETIKINLVNPKDLFNEIQLFADLKAQISLDTPRTIRTAEGELRYTQNPSSLSDSFAETSEPITNNLTQEVLESVNNTKRIHPLYDTGEKSFNNVFLNNFLQFDNSYEFAGVENKWKSSNYSNITTKDIYIAMFEQMFGREALMTSGRAKYHILLSPFADKSKTQVLPVMFMQKGGKEVLRILKMKEDGLEYSKGEIARGFDSVVKYYDNVQKRAEEDVLSTLDNETILIDGKSVKITKKNFRKELSNAPSITVSDGLFTKIRLQLSVDSHYNIETSNILNNKGEIVHEISMGNSFLLKNTVFDRTFINEWKNQKSHIDKYKLLFGKVEHDYQRMLLDMKHSGALKYLVDSSKMKFGKKNSNVLTQGQEVSLEGSEVEMSIEDINQSAKDSLFALTQKDILYDLTNRSFESIDDMYKTLGDEAGKVFADLKRKERERDQRYEQEISNWLESKGYKSKNLSALKREVKAEYDGVLSKMKEQESVREAIEFTESVNEIKSNQKSQLKAAREGIVKEMKIKDEYPEALYMTYFLVNESISHLARGNITTFKNPSQYIKRGSGMSAPGTSFDWSNPRGAGTTANVLMLEDIAGTSPFLGVPDPGHKLARKMYTDGESTLNPIWHKLLQRSAGGKYGVIGDYANKTVVYGYDAYNHRKVYFKFSQSPINAYQYKNSKYYQDMFHRMLGKEGVREAWDNAYQQTGQDFDRAIDIMADYVVDNLREDGTPLRDSMVSYAVYESSSKEAPLGINRLEYREGYPRTADNVIFPIERELQTLEVPNDFMRLQVVNNADGGNSVHSFATQLYSLIGIGDHNYKLKEDYDSALMYEVNQFIEKYKEIYTDDSKSIDDKRHEILNMIKESVYDNTAHAIRGSKMEELLTDRNTVGEVFGDKLFQAIISELNEHLKPNTPGGNYVQLSSKELLYDNGAGNIFLPQEMSTDGSYAQRLIRPLSYYSKSKKKIYDNRAEFNNDMENNQNDVVAVPAEVVMSFQYADKFMIGKNETLQSVFNFGGVSMYETGLQRALGEGAESVYDVELKLYNILLANKQQTASETFTEAPQKSFNEMSPREKAEYIKEYQAKRREAIKKDVSNANITGQDVMDMVTPAGRERLTLLMKHAIRKNWVLHHTERLDGKNVKKEKSDKLSEYTAKTYNDILRQPISFSGNNNSLYSSILSTIAEYFYDLNNALDLVSIRIPTTNASSASAGRIVAWADIGNTILTSAEKSILDGSDYDHDELHVFYPSLTGRKRSRVENIDDQNRTKKQNENLMFDSMFNFYADPRNQQAILTPINLDSFRNRAAGSEFEAPAIANTPTHNVNSIEINQAGIRLVGHFANLMIYTSKLISNNQNNLGDYVSPELQTVFKPENYNEVVDLISKYVNAAVDNANEEGLLGRLNITQSVTPLIAGLMLTGKNETEIFDILSNQDILKAAKEVNDTNSVTHQRKKAKLWDRLPDEYKKYAYIGEQLNRLGSFYKITQKMDGRRSEFARQIFNMEKNLGMPIDMFLENMTKVNDANNPKSSPVNYSDANSALNHAKIQVDYLIENGIIDKADRSSEIAIRKQINIEGLIADNPLIVSQLHSIQLFREMMQSVYFSEQAQEIKNTVLEKIGKVELLYEDAFNDYENSIKKHLIGYYFQQKGKEYQLGHDAGQDFFTRSYDLKSANDQIQFIANFPRIVQNLKNAYPDMQFLKKIDFTSYGKENIPIGELRNSTYMDAGEKAFYRREFKRLSEIDAVAANAIRDYQILVYGFSFRGGTLSEVLDSKSEIEFSESFKSIKNSIYGKHDSKKNELALGIILNADKIIDTTQGNINNKSDVIKKESSKGNITIFAKVSDREGKHKSEGNMVLINPMYYKHVYVLDPNNTYTHEYTYNKLTPAEMTRLDRDGTIQKNTAQWSGVKKNAPENPTQISSFPHSGSTVVTPFGQIATVEVEAFNKITLNKQGGSKVSQSKITRKGSSISEKALSSLMSVFKKSFKGVNVEYVDNSTSLTDGIAYYNNGTVYINTDKVQPDTPLHELTHPLLHVLKEARPGQYNTLKEDALSMLEAENPLAMMVKENYPELSLNDLADEIISTYVGFVSEGQVEAFMLNADKINGRSKAKTLWSRIKGSIDGFWASIKALFSSKKINIDPRTSTIKDFANEIVTKAMKGENILNLTNSELMNMTRAAYDNIYNQKTDLIKTIDIYDALMNTGKIKEGDMFKEVKQYRHFSEAEKIQRIISQLDRSGVNIYFVRATKDKVEFDPKERSKWPDIIREKILPYHDDSRMPYKEDLLKAINSKNADTIIENIREIFGKDDLGNYHLNEAYAKKFLRQIRWSAAHKYMSYSELANDPALSAMYNPDLKGFDPIVAIEHNRDGQMIISLLDFTTESIRKRDELSPLERRNILNEYISDGHARRKGISLISNHGDVSNMMMSLIASHIVANKKNVMINNIGTISINPMKATMNLLDGAEMKNNFDNMLKIDKFKDNLAPETIALIENFKTITDGFDFEAVLANKYGDTIMKEYTAEHAVKSPENVTKRKQMLTKRLRDLLTQENITSNQMNEINIIINAISHLDSGNLLSTQMNTRQDLNKMQSWISPQYDVGHQLIDVVRRSALNVAQDNIREMQQFKRDTNNVWQYFEERWLNGLDTEGKNNLGQVDPYVKDVTHKYYNDIIAKVKDTEGVMRNSGHILWTTDKNLDPLFYEQAQKIESHTPGILKMGERIADMITDIMVDAFYAARTKKMGHTVKVDGSQVSYTKEMARKDMFEHTTYKKGMLPLMPDTFGQLLSKGKMYRAMKLKQKQIESAYVSFEDISNLSESDAAYIDNMPDIFLGQFAGKNSEIIGTLGSNYRTRTYLGITETENGYYYDAESGRNDNINTDLETLVEFFKMSTMRKNKYEAFVLPLINGVKTYMNDIQSNMDFKQENALNYLDLYLNQAIFNKRKKESLPIAGIEMTEVANTAMSYASPLVMIANINVGAVSAIHNGMMAYIEGISTDIFNALNPDEKRYWFGTKELTQGSGVYFSDWGKTMEMMREFMILNSNEYEITTHRFHQKRKKHIMSDYYAQWTNWAADAYARGVVMNAQMIKDGSYQAHTLDKETGMMKYDPRKDKRFEILFDSKADKSSKEYKKAEALYESLKNRLVSEGYGLTDDGHATRGYSNVETRAFKSFADKYITGAYGAMEKNLLSQFVLGRMAMMFTTWLMTKASAAFKQGSYIDEIGYIDIKEDINGNFIPYWQREWTEGYMTTVMRMTFDLIRHGDVKQFKNMNQSEKLNWIKYGSIVMTFLSSWLLYGLVVKEDDDDKGLIPEWRLMRNFRYSYGSLMVLSTVYEKLNSPFAVVGIVKRALSAGISLLDPTAYRNLRFAIPGMGGILTVTEPLEDIFMNE